MLPNHNNNNKKEKSSYMLAGLCHRTMFSLFKPLPLSWHGLGTSVRPSGNVLSTTPSLLPGLAPCGQVRVSWEGDEVGLGEPAWSSCCPSRCLHHCPSRCLHHRLSTGQIRAVTLIQGFADLGNDKRFLGASKGDRSLRWFLRDSLSPKEIHNAGLLAK